MCPSLLTHNKQVMVVQAVFLLLPKHMLYYQTLQSPNILHMVVVILCSCYYPSTCCIIKSSCLPTFKSWLDLVFCYYPSSCYYPSTCCVSNVLSPNIQVLAVQAVFLLLPKHMLYYQILQSS